MKNLSFFKKRSSRSWFVQFTDDLGKRRQRSTGCTLKKDAVAWVDEHEAELCERKQKPLNFSSFISDFLQYAETQFRPGTVTLYRLALESFQGSIGNISINVVTVRDVDAWKSSLLSQKTHKGTHFTPTYINILFRSLKAAFNTALRWQLIKVNPFVSSKTVPLTTKMPAFLTVEDFGRLIMNVPEGALRDFIIFAINTGARRGEILSLKWSSVDTERRFFIIRNTDTFKTKTGRERVVPLTDAALSVLLRRKEAARSEFSDKASINDEYIFHNNGTPLPADTITHSFKRAVRRCGLSEKIHVHSLRHTCASLLMQSGANITAIKELLGHSTISTTQIYLHNTPDSLRRELEKIPSLA